MIEIIYMCGGILIGIVATRLFMLNAKKKFGKSLWDQRGTGKFGIINCIDAYGNAAASIELEQIQEAGDKTKVKIINIITNKNKTKENALAHIRCDEDTKETWITNRHIIWNK